MKKPYIPFRNQSKHRQRDEQTAQGSGTDHIPFRLNLLFCIVFILFTILVVQLFRLDVVDAKKFDKRLNAETQTVVQLNNAPRGSIYDNDGKELVTNKANQAIIYTKKRGITTQEMLDTANELSKLISVSTDNLTTRDKKDYYLASKKHNEAVLDSIPKSKLSAISQDSAKTYQLELKYVPKSAIDYSESELNAVAIYKKMNGAQTLTPTFIKNRDVSNEEIAVVGENENHLEGVSTSVDWSREYLPAAKSMKTILGTVSSESTGLPANLAKKYLKEGYSLNDRVGLSYLEQSYEKYLHGTRGETEIFTNNKQEITKQKVIKKAKKGDNLKLTVNAEFQSKLTDLVKNFYSGIVGSNPASEGVYVIVNNPKTGGIIGLAGYARDTKTGKVTEDTLGTINKAFIPGSVVKPATITAGYQNKAISGNEVLTDTPIVLGHGSGAVRKSSIFNRSGTMQLNTVEALTLSSNVYMMQIVFRMLGVQYTSGMTMPNDISPIKKLRKVYKQYGLGAETGVDVDGETTGFINNDFYDKNGNIKPGTQGNMLDLSYGNYDTYSTLQLSQYVSTLANSGKRVAPHFVEGIYSNNAEGGLGKEIKQIEPKVLNTVKLSKSEWNIIHEGMYQVVHNAQGTGAELNGTKFNISAKTGTAETYGYNTNTGKVEATVNCNLISYVNSDSEDQTQLAVTVMLPKMAKNNEQNVKLAKKIYELYYKQFKYETQQ